MSVEPMDVHGSRDSRPTKSCATCGRAMTWRKRWARTWHAVRYCSDACRRHRPDATDEALERAIVDLLATRARGATIGPADAARAVALDWQALIERAKSAARRLMAKGQVEIAAAAPLARGAVPQGIRIRRRG
jgi:hypothetical protein